jgi:hypothetical protein
LEKNFAKASQIRPDFGRKPQQASVEQDGEAKLRTLADPPCRPTESCDDLAVLVLCKFSRDLFNRGGDEVSLSLLLRSLFCVSDPTSFVARSARCTGITKAARSGMDPLILAQKSRHQSITTKMLHQDPNSESFALANTALNHQGKDSKPAAAVTAAPSNIVVPPSFCWNTLGVSNLICFSMFK